MYKLFIIPALLLGLMAPAEAKKNNKRTEKQRVEEKYGRRDTDWSRRTTDQDRSRTITDDDYRYRTDRRYRDNWGTNERFRGMDRDNDGYITRREWRGNSQSFSRQDRNRDGVISHNER